MRKGAAAAAWVLLACGVGELEWLRAVIARGGVFINDASSSSFCAESIALERGLTSVAAFCCWSTN